MGDLDTIYYKIFCLTTILKYASKQVLPIPFTACAINDITFCMIQM